LYCDCYILKRLKDMAETERKNVSSNGLTDNATGNDRL
jgi:hypothetical protein